MPSQVETKQRESRLISIAPEARLPSRLPSQLPEGGRQSHLASHISDTRQGRRTLTNEDLPKISFSEVRPSIYVYRIRSFTHHRVSQKPCN